MSADPSASAQTPSTQTTPAQADSADGTAAQAPAVQFGIEDGIAVVTLANPPVNGLSDRVRAGLAGALDEIEAADGLIGVVLTGAGRGFCGGADVRQFNTPAAHAEPRLRDVLARLVRLPVPVVAALHGFALGGGLELALGAHIRIAQEGTEIGLTETTLGLIPGGGGTQRLPRLVGAQRALDVILAGARLTAAQAADLGIVESVFTGDPVAAGIEAVRVRAASGEAVQALDDQPVPDASAIDFEAARTKARRNRRNARALLAAIDAVEAATRLPLEEGLDHERALFTELVEGPESKALRYLFFAERTAARVEALPRDTATRAIGTAAVIGSGTMGAGIAMSLADAGIPTTLVDTTDEAIDRARGRIRATYESQARKGRIDTAEAEARIARITPTTRQEDVADADIIIEAVFEDLDVKRTVFGQLDAIAKDGAILATNTSRLDVNLIADATARPQDVIGLHFFSPANVMRLLEVVQGAKTADDVLATAMALAGRIGKQPALSQVGEGFIGNRMLSPYRREAEQLLESGASPRQVDDALEAFGFAMGPFAMSDLAGIDVSEAGRRTFRVTADPVLLASQSDIPTKLYEAGRYGQKTGAGFYRYVEGDRTRYNDPVVEAIIEECAAASGVTRRTVTDEEIVERCVLALVNEAAKLLEDGIAQRASDVDVVWVAGYNFPAFRGGPLFWADQQGLDHVVARMREFQETLGEYWRPAELLVRTAEAGATMVR